MAEYCGRCHSCGGPIRIVLDGEEWCQNCETYQRPISHGWHDSLSRVRGPAVQNAPITKPGDCTVIKLVSNNEAGLAAQRGGW